MEFLRYTFAVSAGHARPRIPGRHRRQGVRIGGGAFIAPFCVAWFGLPVYAVEGTALAASFLTSLAGVALYSLAPAPPGLATHPDWLLGALFGAGGMLGMYLGARLQRNMPQAVLKLLLGVMIALLAPRCLLALVW